MSPPAAWPPALAPWRRPARMAPSTPLPARRPPPPWRPQRPAPEDEAEVEAEQRRQDGLGVDGAGQRESCEPLPVARRRPDESHHADEHQALGVRLGADLPCEERIPGEEDERSLGPTGRQARAAETIGEQHGGERGEQHLEL